MQRIYEKIVTELETDIQRGVYKTSRKLPSVRVLASQYACSKSTVIRAFETLKNNHLIYSVPQSGYYVIEHVIQNQPSTISMINFSTGNPRIGDMHTPDLKHCLDRAVDIYKDKSGAHPLTGIDSLRELLPKYLADSQIFANYRQVFINLGIQAALSILTQLPFPNGKETILIEQPTYKYFIDFLKFTKASVCGIRRSGDGIDLNELEHLFKHENIKFFYTVPKSHNPLGTAYSLYERKAIAELAAKYDVYIVEDDYFGDIPLSRYYPIFAYGDHYHHIYLRNYSKVLPWIRVGIIVMPNHLLDIFSEHVEYSYFYSYFRPSMVSQATLEIYIRSKLLNKHTHAIQKELSERTTCLNEYFPRFKEFDAILSGGTGFYSYLKLPAFINETEFISKLNKKNVLVVSGKSFYLDNSFYEKGIRLSIAQTHPEEIRKGCEIIYNELKKYQPTMR